MMMIMSHVQSSTNNFISTSRQKKLIAVSYPHYVSQCYLIQSVIILKYVSMPAIGLCINSCNTHLVSQFLNNYFTTEMVQVQVQMVLSSAMLISKRIVIMSYYWSLLHTDHIHIHMGEMWRYGAKIITELVCSVI